VNNKNIASEIAFLVCISIFSMSMFSAGSGLKNGYLGIMATGYPLEMVRNELIVAKAQVNLAGDGMILFSLTENTDMADMKRILKSFTQIFSRNEKEQPELAKLKENGVIREFRTMRMREDKPRSKQMNSQAISGKETEGVSSHKLDQSQLKKDNLDIKIQSMEKIVREYRSIRAELAKNK